ncbi:MAG: molybdopterin-binding protein [Methanoregulaceae archaeon]
MKISARNILKGKVKKITPGSVNSEVTLELPNGAGDITSIITKKAVENLGLQAGSTAYAVIKSSEVMIAVDK